MVKKILGLFLIAFLVLGMSSIVFASDELPIVYNEAVLICPEEKLLNILASDRGRISDDDVLVMRLIQAIENGEDVYISTFENVADGRSLARIDGASAIIFRDGVSWEVRNLRGTMPIPITMDGTIFAMISGQRWLIDRADRTTVIPAGSSTRLHLFGGYSWIDSDLILSQHGTFVGWHRVVSPFL